jgi:hypothetical protein
MDPDEGEEGISRRRMIKRMGAGAAVAWSAPVLMSIQSPAFAQASPTCEVFDCIKFPLCGQAPGCPTSPPECQGHPCVRLFDNSCICVNNGQPSVPDCDSDDDCEAQFGPGFRCGPVENCGASTGCFLPCGVGASIARRWGLRPSY